MDFGTLAIAAAPAFIASAVEFVEATTIVLAVGITRGWRAPLAGTALATLTLAATATPTVTPTALTTLLPTATVSPTVLAAALPDAQLRRPEGLALDRDGNLWVADYGRDRVVKLAPDGRLLQSLGSRGNGAGEFVGPKGVAIDPTSGRLYVADTGNARVQRLAPDGTPEATWPLP